MGGLFGVNLNRNMKATPELLQRALRNLEIGLSPEISAKILATVRMLDEKGAEASLIDFALIEVCYTEKIEPQSEPLIIDLSELESKDVIVLRNENAYTVSLIEFKGHGRYTLYDTLEGSLSFIGSFYINGRCNNISTDIGSHIDGSEPYDIVKIIKPTKPQ